MASVRGFAEFAGGWGGCGRDAFDHELPSQVLARPETERNQNHNVLARTIEKQIIPRLLQVHRPKARSAAHANQQINHPSIKEIIRFADLLVKEDVAIASDFVETMCRNGTPLEVIFLELFAPAARHIGILWDKDICSFTDVTIALSRLQQLLRELSAAVEVEGEAVLHQRSALLVAAPGDQHTFGVFLVQEFFRRAGWHVEGGFLKSSDELLGLVHDGSFDLVGLSVSNDVGVEDLTSIIRAVREAASPRVPNILVGGRFFLDRPECVGRVGADTTAQDGRRAVLGVSRLLSPNMSG